MGFRAHVQWLRGEAFEGSNQPRVGNGREAVLRAGPAAEGVGAVARGGRGYFVIW